MARRFAKVSEEEIEESFFYPSDLVNTKTTIPLRVGEERWIHASTLRVSVYIHHYSPPLRGIVVYYFQFAYVIFFASLCSFFSVVKTMFLSLHSTFVARLFSFFLFLAWPSPIYLHDYFDMVLDKKGDCLCVSLIFSTGPFCFTRKQGFICLHGPHHSAKKSITNSLSG